MFLLPPHLSVLTPKTHFFSLKIPFQPLSEQSIPQISFSVYSTFLKAPSWDNYQSI